MLLMLSDFGGIISGVLHNRIPAYEWSLLGSYLHVSNEQARYDGQE